MSAPTESPVVIHTPNKERYRRNAEVCNNLPVPTFFGNEERNYNRDYFINTIHKGTDVLMIPLKECLDNYFQDGDLQRLAQVTLPTTKPKSPIEKEPFNPPVYMFFYVLVQKTLTTIQSKFRSTSEAPTKTIYLLILLRHIKNYY